MHLKNGWQFSTQERVLSLRINISVICRTGEKFILLKKNYRPVKTGEFSKDLFFVKYLMGMRFSECRMGEYRRLSSC